jgi:hypothetical protein
MGFENRGHVTSGAVFFALKPADANAMIWVGMAPLSGARRGRMVIGLGTDLIEIERIEDSIRRFGDRFLDRVFTPGEIAYCLRKKSSAESFAARFAAKEAGAKALGTGISRGRRLRFSASRASDPSYIGAGERRNALRRWAS